MINHFHCAAGRMAALCTSLVAASLIASAPARADEFPVDVDIVTADAVGAGTDAVPISLTISYINTDGEENGYLLRIDDDIDPQTGENRFERGKKDTFRVELPTEVDHFTQIELSTDIANIDHVSQTFTMAPWRVESVTLTPARNRKLPDGEILAIMPTVIHIDRQIDANIPTIIAYPDDHPTAATEPVAGADPVEQPVLQPDPTADSPNDSGPNKERCKALVQDHVAWDQNPRNTHWADDNLDALCSIAATPEQIVACFQHQLIASNYNWRAALTTCQTGAGSTSAGVGTAPPAVTGLNASWVQYGDKSHHVLGYFVQTDAVHWEERNSNQEVQFAFDEEVRTAGAIRLIDRSRNIRVELNFADMSVDLLDESGRRGALDVIIAVK